MNRHVLMGLLAAGLATCVAASPISDEAAPAGAREGEAKARAQSAAKDFSATLKSALLGRIATEGTSGAIAFCREEAPKIATRVSSEYRVRIGRVPVPGRQRNPANVPEPWQAEGLAAFQAHAAEGVPVAELVRIVDHGLPDGVALRMMRGIAIEPMCLACHGKWSSPETHAALDRFYPADRATGFEVGDLRGALWVEVRD